MKIFKRILQILGVILLTAYLVFAWVKNTQENASTASTTDTNVIRIGTEGTYEPFSYYNKDNQLVGFDVDVAKAVFKELGMKVQFIDAPWDSMIAAFNAGKTDIVFNQVGITPERKAKFLLSTPYSYSHASLIVHKNNSNITSFNDLRGKRSAQSLTSNYGALAEKYGAKIVNTDAFTKGADLIIEGRADATLNDDVVFYDYLKHKPNAPLKIVKKAADSVPTAALIHRNQQSLKQKVDQALKKLRANGELIKISERYFGKDITKN